MDIKEGVPVHVVRWQCAQHDRQAAAAPRPLLDVATTQWAWVVTAFMLGAVAGDAPSGPARPGEPLTHGETRVLRYLPSNLSAREIAGELYLSMNTVKTHQRHLYRKLGARTRSEAVERARALGLLAPSPVWTAGRR